MVTPTITLTPHPLIISEVFPKPSQGNEWVELYNPNTTDIALAEWELWDELSQPSLIFSFTTENLSARQWLVVPINKKLNDSEDGLTLKKPDGTIADTMHYQGTETDLSWSRQGLQITDSWNLIESSPGLPNPIPTSTPTPTPTPTITPTPTSSQTPSKIPIIVTITASPQPAILKSPLLHFIPTHHTSIPTPATFPTPSLTPTIIPTFSLKKPKPDQNSPPSATPTPNSFYYFLGICFIQLSSIGMALSKQGMIGADVVAKIPQNLPLPARYS